MTAQSKSWDNQVWRCNETAPSEGYQDLKEYIEMGLLAMADDNMKTWNIPRDPYQWSTDDTYNWIVKTMEQMGLVNDTKYIFAETIKNKQITGSILAAMKEWEFAHTFPGNKLDADVVYNCLQCWIKASVYSSTRYDQLKPDARRPGRTNLPKSGRKPRRKAVNRRLSLKKYIMECLEEPGKAFSDELVWVQRSEGIFRFCDGKERFAERWGRMKGNNETKTPWYSKMARSLRIYQRKGVMQNCKKQLHYKFVLAPSF
ncbi:SAM pointed domain-containing Ets transcription factor-like [Ptychodera flava]|uniref:SAM pointed domain-containing Ets transcription factor-like n=1 Tax=Ptychodera flava TaxID=63121 RepID=UPI003969F14B